jgi:PAS domain S-box-containing protein
MKRKTPKVSEESEPVVKMAADSDSSDDIDVLRNRIKQLEKSEKSLKKKIDVLTQEHAVFHQLLDNIPDSLFIKDLDSKFILVNKTWARNRNVDDINKIIGKTDFEFLSKEKARETFEDEQRIIASGVPIIGKIEKIIRPDGRTRWIHLSKVPIKNRNGKVIATCGISRDITELKQTEDTLEKERNLLRTIIDNLPDSIYVKDTKSRFVLNSKAHIQLCQASSQQELLGKTDLDVFKKDFASRYFSDEQIVLQTGRSLIDREEPSRKADGSLIWLSTTKVAIRDAGGNIVGLVGISRDITERKQFEEALQKANDELEIRVEERTSDLKTANEQLQTHINQLRFLNTSAYELARLIHMSELVPAILHSFVSRFQHAEAALSVHIEGKFRCVAATDGLDNFADTESCEKLLAPFLGSAVSKIVFVKDRLSDEFLRNYSLQGAEGLPVYLAIPMFTGDNCGAVIQIFTTPDFIGYFEYEQFLLSTLAAQAAACLANAVHYREAQERARLQGELDSARSIQQRFTPREQPDIPRVQVKGVYYPAFEIGGDYLDYFKTETGEWVIAIADVCGKGIPAALFMAMLRSVFRVEARNAGSARDLLCRVNESMKDTLMEKNFVTALCLMIDKDSSYMTYARAGHPMLMKLSSSSAEPQNVQTSGVAMGLLFSEDFAKIIEEKTIPLNRGDRFLIYTDGLTDATDPDRNMYGLKRLVTLLSSDHDSTPEQLISIIMNDIKEFTQESPYHDDLTILCMQVTG